MRIYYKAFLFFLFLPGYYQVAAQTTDTLLTDTKTGSDADSKVYANPSVSGMGKSKGIIINYEGQPAFGISSVSPEPGIGNKKAEVRRNNKLDIKAYVPIINNPHFKMVGGFNYFFEEFNFENYDPPKPPTYDFYTNLEDKNLKTISGQLVMLKALDEVNFFVFRIKGELNGDYSTKEVAVSDYLKTSAEILYGWKKNENLSYGVGLQLSYALGRRRIFPAFMYNKTFNPKWGIESILPANADLRYNASEKSLWYLGFSLDGASYNINIDKPEFANYETLELRRSEIRGRLRWEREIYDFLWFGMEAGYRHNINFNAFEKDANDGFMFGKRDELPIIDSKLKGAALFNVEIFLVPPKRFLKAKPNQP